MEQVSPALLAKHPYDVLGYINLPNFEGESPIMGRLIQHTRKEVLGCRRFGRVSYKRLNEALAVHGLRLGMQLPDRTYEIGRLDMLDIACRFAAAAQVRSDIVAIEVDLPFACRHPVYGDSIKAAIDLGRLLHETTVSVQYDPAQGCWCPAEIAYHHYLRGNGYIRLGKEPDSVPT